MDISPSSARSLPLASSFPKMVSGPLPGPPPGPAPPCKPGTRSLPGCTQAGCVYVTASLGLGIVHLPAASSPSLTQWEEPTLLWGSRDPSGCRAAGTGGGGGKRGRGGETLLQPPALKPWQWGGGVLGAQTPLPQPRGPHSSALPT